MIKNNIERLWCNNKDKMGDAHNELKNNLFEKLKIDKHKYKCSMRYFCKNDTISSTISIGYEKILKSL